jgi:DNA-directed RNA polymerase
MQKFTPYEYMLISLANANGMDKLLWEERIAWSDTFIKMSVKDQLEYANEECTGEPLLLAKGINAHSEILKGNEVGFMCNLDATASGIQVMSAITGCHQSAAKVNLIDNGKRNDLYLDTAHIMNNKYGCNVNRNDLKDPIMHAFYGSEATPKKVFGKGTPELAAFIKTLKTGLKGAYSLLLDLQSLQNSNAKSYTWTLPDGHTSYVPVMEAVDKKIEIAEFNKATFTFRTKVNQPKEFDLSIAANVVHSIDGYIVRQLFRRAKRMGYHMTAIHDSFWAHPNNMEDVRIGYADELAKLARSNVIQNILNDLSGNPAGIYGKCSNDLADLIENSNYALS